MTVTDTFYPGQFPVLNYNISYNVNGGSFSHHLLVDGDLNEYTLTSLSHSTTYVFVIAAINDIGEGGKSANSASITTLGEPDAPKSPLVTSSTTTSVSLQWDEPYDHASPITNYSVTLASSAGLQWDRCMLLVCWPL
jgi:hypothetical protein